MPLPFAHWDSSSPRIFTKVMKPIFSSLRSRFGHICLNYMDNSLCIGTSALQCTETTLHAVELFSKLGLNINPDRSVLIPSQTIEFLGFVIDSVTMTALLVEPRVKVGNLVSR